MFRKRGGLAVGITATLALGTVSAQLPAYLVAQQRDAHAALRKAIVGLRDARAGACRFNVGDDCELAELSDIELTLFDTEEKARSTGAVQPDEEARSRFERIQSAAAEAREKVSDLADALKKLAS